MTDVDKLLWDFVATIEDEDLRQKVAARLKRNSHVVTGAILTKDDGRICLVQELKKAVYMKWNTPLGHWSYGESMADAAMREVKEETGYDIELIGLLPLENVYDENVLRIIYTGKVVGGSPEERDKSEINAVEWFSLEEIRQKYHNGELRDACCMQDVELFVENKDKTLPLDTILDIASSGDFDKGGVKMSKRELVIHGVYRHYKGGLYLVEGVAVHSEDLSEYVVYRPLYGDSDGLWIRPKEMFLEKYDGENYRFEYVEGGIKNDKSDCKCKNG